MLALKKNLGQALNNRNNFLKFKRHRKKFITSKIKNDRWQPWPRWKRRLPKFLKKRRLVKKLGNISYYKGIYRYIDGIYNSFWLGKLTNSFVKKGGKATVDKQVLKLLLHMKTYANYSALELLLDSIERVKPILSLGSYVKSGKKTEYPVFLKAEKRRRIALQNIVKMIKSIEGQKLHQKIAEGIIDLATVTEDGKYDLAFNRDELFELISLRGENLRAAVRHLRRK